MGTLLAGTGAGTSRAALRGPGSADAPLRAALIGHTGRGNFGHRLDVIFRDREGIEVVAVADADGPGRVAAQKRSGAARGYAKYEEMLHEEQPDLVAVCPRDVDQHHAMGMAALQSGAHVYMEKPFAENLAQADELLSEGRKRNLKIAVAHQMRLAPGILLLQAAIAEGALIGDLLEVRMFGKQDDRAGGEDMMVLGTHLFDLARFFAGNPLWCTSRVLNDEGRDVTRADARPGKNDVLGPVAGREIDAQFAFANGVSGRFMSRRRQQRWPGSWGLVLVGSRGAAHVRAGHPPELWVLTPPEDVDAPLWQGPWERWAEDAAMAQEETLGDNASRMDRANRRVVDDWLVAIKDDREPQCSGEAAMRALEMIHAVYWAALEKGRVPFPLEERRHPLT
jgi:predicted dehydrogenase